MITIGPATPSDVVDFFYNIRPADRAEFEAASGMTVQDGLLLLLKWTEAGYPKVLKEQRTGEVLGIGGVDSLGNRDASVWLLLTNAIERHQVEFLRFSKEFLEDLLSVFDTITNTVYANNRLHIKWLTWLGAKWLDGGAFILKKE